MFHVKHFYFSLGRYTLYMGNKEIGNLGEELAAQYLISAGYKILERNVREHIGEIDMIARKGKVLVFVEVKSAFDRDSRLTIQPEENFTEHKKKKFIKAVRLYLLRKRYEGEYRIDVMTVKTNTVDNKHRVVHYENIEA